MTSNVIHLSKRFTHHGDHSGYDRLSAYMPEATVLRRLRVGPGWPIYRRLFKYLVKPRIGNHPYSAINALLELNGYRHYLLHSAPIYHFLYGEESFRLLRVASSSLIASFHQPPSIFHDWGVTGAYLKNLSAIIILAETQRRYFEQFLPSSSIYNVPHGIDTNYFSPPERRTCQDEFRCVTVGSWLRDHETLRAAIMQIQENPGPQRISFDVIGHPDDKKHYSDCPLVTYRSNLPDSELLGLYRRADLAVLSLEDAVANNALLEAMSCGLPIVVTDVGAVREYTGDSCVAFVAPKSPSELSEMISRLAASPTQRAQLGDAARQQSLRFDWKHAAKRMREVYAVVQESRAQ